MQICKIFIFVVFLCLVFYAPAHLVSAGTFEKATGDDCDDPIVIQILAKLESHTS